LSIATPSGNSTEIRSSGALRPAYLLVVFGLLMLIGAQILLSIRQESQTFDESDHLYAGYEYWKHGDFGRNPEHPPLAKLVASAGLLTLHPKEPAPVITPWFKTQDFLTASAFLYHSDADKLLARGRAMMLIFVLGLALAVFFAGHEMFSQEAGLLALAIFAFEPMLLAHGGLITTDMALSCMLFVSVYAFYRYVKRPTPTRLLLLGVAVGLTLAAKQSGVFVFLILGILCIAELLLTPAQALEPRVVSRRRVAKSLAIALVATAGISYIVLWAFYGFHYAARPPGMLMAPTLEASATAIPNHFESTAILFCSRHHLLPEAYLFGWSDILQIPGVRVTYLLGKLYLGRRWFLFPVMMLVKSTPALLVLLALTPFARLWRSRREFLFLAVPAVTYLFIAMLSGMNAESRYILPIYPFAIMLAGAAAWKLSRESRGWAVAITCLVILTAASSLHAFPDYLAYVNEAFGGPSNSYRVVSDSNGDWAQGLKWTKTYLDANHITECWFDYSDPLVDPEYYGIPCKPLTSGWVHRGIPGPVGLPATINGTVLISASELSGHLWGPGVLNPYEQFGHLRPDANPGKVTLVYHGTFDVPLLSAYSHLAAAGLLMREDKLPEAVGEAEQARQLAPNSADIQAGLARIFRAAGRTAEADQASAVAIHLRQTIHPEFQGAQ
jgi:hypothetical protein